MNKNLKSFSDT